MKINVPKIFEEYVDYQGRELYILKVDLKNRQDRHIQGTILTDNEIHDYACNIDIWSDIWRDKTPRANPNKMKIG